MIQDKEIVETLKHFAKQLFKSVENTPHGFLVDGVTVLIKGGCIEISDFSSDGRPNTASFLMPESAKELLNKMTFHCGKEKISQLVRNNITIL
jgi:hypothetical protein